MPPRTPILLLVAASALAGCTDLGPGPLAISFTPDAAERPEARTPLSFRAEGTSASGGAAWDFGDGTTATGRAVTHAYAGGGRYTVTLRDGGHTASTTVAVWDVTDLAGTASPSSGGAPGSLSSHDVTVAPDSRRLSLAIALEDPPLGSAVVARLVDAQGTVVESVRSPSPVEAEWRVRSAGMYRLQVWTESDPPGAAVLHGARPYTGVLEVDYRSG